MAEKLGVSKNTLAAYEHEKTLPDQDFLADFAKATGHDLGMLVKALFESSANSPQLLAALKTIKFATDSAAKFALRRSGISSGDLSRLQAAAFERGLDDDGLEAEFGGEFPISRSAGALSTNLVEQPRAGYAYIPLYDVRARGGANGAVVDGESVLDVLAFKEDWIRQEVRAAPGDLRLIFVEGDSMVPDLRPGDIVMIDHTDTSARREGAYVIRMDGALLVKTLQRLPGGVIKVISRNAAYEPFTVNVSALAGSDDFAIIGRVVWGCRRF
jgi:phage repressor protein C with HTH and peptisase S24 domain